MIWHKFGLRSKIRQQTLQLVSLLSRWCQVREDLLFAFEKSLSTGLENPMRKAVEDLLTRVRGGLSIDQALNLMQDSINHEHFQDLITAIRFNFRYRGDLPALLELLEIQLHKIEEEYANRRLSNNRDRNLTVIILTLVPLFYLLRLLSSSASFRIFTGNGLGIALLAISLAAWLLAIVCFLIIQRRITG